MVKFVTRQEAQAPFDLHIAPLWRVKLIMPEVSENEHQDEYILLVTLHHIIAMVGH